jgi:hypothetical protein
MFFLLQEFKFRDFSKHFFHEKWCHGSTAAAMATVMLDDPGLNPGVNHGCMYFLVLSNYEVYRQLGIKPVDVSVYLFNKQEIPCTTEARSTFFGCRGSNSRSLGFFIISMKFPIDRVPSCLIFGIWDFGRIRE